MQSSWLLLDRQDARYTLPADLRDSDAFSARDVGWVEQMRPFITAFSQPRDLVLDPFAGFGTTLVAAALEGRRGVGVEIDASRGRKIGERLARLGLAACDVHVGDCLALASELPPVNLVLTSVPYFGCRGGLEGDNGQRYGDPHYALWLERMRLTFKALEQVLAPGGHCIVMAENLRLGAHFVPQAWDLARVLAERFVMQDERLIVYPARSSRSHEYALIARHECRALDLGVTVDVLRELSRTLELVVYGSLATFVRGGQRRPSDADVLLHPGTDVVRVVRQLEDEGFRVTRWGEPVNSTAAAPAMRSGLYLLAERLDREARLCRIDLAVAASADEFSRRVEDSDAIDGIRFVRSRA